MKRTCRQCGRPIRSDSQRAIFLYLEPGDREIWLCGPRCEKSYNDDEPAKGWVS